MITKEQFIQLITANLDHRDRLREVENVLKCNIYECDWIEYGDTLFEEVLQILFQKEAADNIITWMYQRDYIPVATMHDGTEFPEFIEDLWEKVKDYRK